MFIDHPVCLHPNSLLNVYYIHINFHSIHFPKARTNPSSKNTKYLQTFSQVDWYEEDVDQLFALKKQNKSVGCEILLDISMVSKFYHE